MSKAQSGFAGVVGFERAVWYFACVAPFQRKALALDAGVQTFENHAHAQRLLLALAVVTVMEAVPLHFLLQAWKPAVAWVVLALTLYGLIWIAGVSRAYAARPHLLSAERLLLRVSLFYTVAVDRALITRAAQYDATVSQPDVTSLKVVTKPNVLLELSTPIAVHGPFGRTQLATQLAFYAERADELILQAHPRRDPKQQ